MTRRRLLALGWLLVLGLTAWLPLGLLFSGRIHVGGTLALHRPPTQPVIALGANVDLPRGSRSVIMAIGGDIRLHGRATQDLVALDGRVYLYPRAETDADVLSIIGGIYRAPDVTVLGRLGGALQPWDGRNVDHGRDIFRLLATSIRLGLAAGLALVLAGACLTIIFPWQIVLISTTLRGAPLKSSAAGAMIALTFLFLVVPLGLSLAGLPFALLLAAAAALAWLFGMTAVAVIVGRSFSRRPAPLLWAAAAGLVAIAVTLAVPVIGALAVTLAGLAGAGALAVALVGRARPVLPAS